MTTTENPDPVTSGDAEALQPPDFGPEQLADRVGMEILEYTPERMTGRIPVAGNRQPYGLLHGGASAVLAETLGSLAAALHAGQNRIAVGTELSCTHHRAATDGYVTGVATPLHRGRSTATYDITITDDDGQRICTARLSCLLRDKPPA